MDYGVQAKIKCFLSVFRDELFNTSIFHLTKCFTQNPIRRISNHLVHSAYKLKDLLYFSKKQLKRFFDKFPRGDTSSVGVLTNSKEAG